MTEIAQQLQQGADFHRVGRFADAERCYRRVLELDRRNADAWNLLGLIAQSAGNTSAAIECLREAIALQPQSAAYYNNLGTIFESDGQPDDAIACFQEAVRIRPDYVNAYNNLGEIFKGQGDLTSAIECFREALARDAYFFTCRSNLLVALQHDPAISADALLDEHRRWGQLKRLGAAPRASHANRRDANRPLRIGYVSPDFYEHPVARFFEPVLRHHDRGSFAVYLYAENPGRDTVTQRFQSRAQGWFRTWGLSTQQVVERIVADEIDILVDLAGHTRRHRLDVFCERPAPVQVTYLGYPNTTGLDTIGYRLTDVVLDPPANASSTLEEPLRLPGSFVCLSPPEHGRPCAPPPRHARGFITFGAGHAPVDLNGPLLNRQMRLLATVPRSRLIYFHPQLSTAAAERLRAQLATEGVPLDRIEIRATPDRGVAYWSTIDELDIVLDAFPYSNLPLTCDALWMGVPVVTLVGDRPASRLAASVLERLGLATCVSQSPEDWLNTTVALAHNAMELDRLRTSLRTLVQTELAEGAAFTRALEAQYRTIWRRWCESPAD